MSEYIPKKHNSEDVEICLGDLDNSIKQFADQIKRTLRPTIELGVRRGMQAKDEEYTEQIEALQAQVETLQLALELMQPIIKCGCCDAYDAINDKCDHEIKCEHYWIEQAKQQLAKDKE